MKQKIFLSFIYLQISMAFAMQLSAQVPQLINYQARLTDPATGMPVADGQYSITFAVYDVPVDGTPLWSETQDVQITGGVYSVLLGSSTAIVATTFSGAVRYLGVTVGTDPEMTPRRKIVSVPYAMQAQTAGTVTGPVSESDPVFSASQAAAITADDISHLNNLSGSNTGDQNLSIDGHMLTISGGNTAQIPDSVNDADADPVNEIQTLSLEGNTLSLSKSGGSVQLPAQGTYYYADKDSDGFGNRFEPGYVRTGDSVPSGFVTDMNDCNDEDENINPSSVEIPSDGIDNDCDGEIDETD